ncbi:hypothetical protein RO3G_05861 [Lichtheimia corymbifera JMRC:FSU:9682]|uniref:Tyr recombinase domain-containing protein n=1 Tax=Lichtheimia corymbifera JMRC:FSU:9682 TaxID=1263082 RepID=A0A068SH56_9FUNG|nr:hypothetical protein RO3G_05861 [Lichtheimia corymbifera JMRC:FSU:9682]
MWRIRSDIGRLQWKDVILHKEGTDNYTGVSLVVRMPKEGQVKMSKLGPIEDDLVCPVLTTAYYMEKTRDMRHDLAEDHTFFLGYIERASWVRSIHPATASSWLSQIMKEAGIDTTKYPPHSIRAASATKAVLQGIDIQDVKLHANWSLRTDTFERYYLRPSRQHQRGSYIGNAIFTKKKHGKRQHIGGRRSSNWDWRSVNASRSTS